MLKFSVLPMSYSTVLPAKFQVKILIGIGDIRELMKIGIFQPYLLNRQIFRAEDLQEVPLDDSLEALKI